MLVGTVVVCHFIAVASMLSTFAANVLVFICWVFLVYAIHCNFGSQKWHFLAHYFIGNRFDFVSNLFPVSSEPSLYYRGCLSLFQQLFEKHGALPNDLSCKNVNTLLFSIPGTALGCAAFWASVVGCPINQWASVWCKSRFKIIENKKTIYCGRCYTAWFRSDITWKIGPISTVISMHHVLVLKLQYTVLLNAPELLGFGIFSHLPFHAFWVLPFLFPSSLFSSLFLYLSPPLNCLCSVIL